MDLDDLLDLLDKAGVSKDDLEDALKDLKPGAKAEDVAEAIGKVLGKFGSGVVGGATGVDADLLKLLLELFGPTAKGLLEDIMKELLGEKKGFITRKPGAGPWRRERINKNGPGLQDDYPPDIKLLETPKPGCAEDGRLKVTFKFAIRHREEDIVNLVVEGFNGEMKPVAIGNRINTGNNELVEANGDKDGSSTDAGDWVSFEMTVYVPCEFAIAGGGNLLLQYSIFDEDGNYTTDFIMVPFTNILIDPDKTCCKNFKLDQIKDALLKHLTDAMKDKSFSLDELLEKITKPAEDEEDDKKKAEPKKEEKPAKSVSKAATTKTAALFAGVPINPEVLMHLVPDPALTEDETELG